VPDTGESLLAWLGLPLVLYALCLGCGLAAEAAARQRVANALLPALGFCVAAVVVMPGYRLGAGAWAATPVLLLVASAGFLIGRRELRERLNPGWAGVAFVAAYCLYLAPVVGYGQWTWAGYNFVNDTAVQFLLIDHLGENGTTPPVEGLSTEAERERTSSSDAALFHYLSASYPLGSHGLAAAVKPLVPVPTAALYAPLIAFFAALAAMALAVLAQGAVRLAPAAAVAGFLAVAANLTYAYGQQGNVKEIAALAGIATGAALLAEFMRRQSAGAAALLGIALAGLLSVFSAGGAPYAGLFGLLALGAVALAVRRGAERGAWKSAAALVAVSVAGAIVASDVVSGVPSASEVFSSGAGGDGGGDGSSDGPAGVPPPLGHLLRPLHFMQLAGVWIGVDYRVPVDYYNVTAEQSWATPVTGVLAAIVGVLAVVGLIAALRRRHVGPLILLAVVAVTLAVVAPRVSPYADGKLYALASPAVVLFAALGVVAAARFSRPAAGLAVLALAVGVLLSDAYTYRGAQLAPTDRLQEMRSIADDHGEQGRMLWAEHDEFAKYFAAGPGLVAEYDSVSPIQIGLREPTNYVGRHFDLDEHRLDFLQAFDLLVVRRSPVASRPPGDWRLLSRRTYYDVWQREDAPVVLEHLPLQEIHRRTVVPACREVTAMARRLRDGETLQAVRHQPVVLLDTAAVPRSLGWPSHPGTPATVFTDTPGEAITTEPFAGGRYRLWIRGSFGRTVTGFVDGVPVASARGVESPGEWHPAGEADVTRGTHELMLQRGGGTLRPGDLFNGALGPLAFEPATEPRVVAVGARNAKERLCGRDWDWIERVADA
jgi:hypothetical protein